MYISATDVFGRFCWIDWIIFFLNIDLSDSIIAEVINEQISIKRHVTKQRFYHKMDENRWPPFLILKIIINHLTTSLFMYIVHKNVSSYKVENLI